MKKFVFRVISVVSVLAFAAFVVGGATAAPSQGAEKVYWCHYEPNGNHQTLYLPPTALQQAGHMSASGNPLHAGDYAGACVDDPEPVPGCTDPTAKKYDENATVNDGSCDFGSPPPDGVPGCTDPTALNFDRSATYNDGSCDFGQIPPPKDRGHSCRVFRELHPDSLFCPPEAGVREWIQLILARIRNLSW